MNGCFFTFCFNERLYSKPFCNKRYYNAGEKPIKEILNSHPELIHRVEGRFNCDPTTIGKIYNEINYNWRRLDTIHLLMRWREAGSNIKT